jgi:hypothetical protein
MAEHERARTELKTNVGDVGRGIWLAAAIPPVLWGTVGAVGWWVTAHACPAAERPWSLAAARIFVGVGALVALAATVASLLAARRAWTTLEAAPEHLRERAQPERRRFVAALGLVTCAALILGVVMTGLPSLFLHTCGEMR